MANNPSLAASIMTKHNASAGTSDRSRCVITWSTTSAYTMGSKARKKWVNRAFTSDVAHAIRSPRAICHANARRPRCPVVAEMVPGSGFMGRAERAP